MLMSDLNAPILSPDVGYLIVLSAFWTGGIALSSPGTGILELIGLVNLAAAVITLSLLTVHLWALALLLAGAGVLALEVFRPSRWLLPLIAAVLFSIGSVFLFESLNGELLGVSPWLAVPASIITAGSLGFIIRKVIQSRRIPLAVGPQGLIGQEGFARTAVYAEGTVQVASELWSANSAQQIPAGARVRVLARKGFVLTVEQETS